MVKYGRRKQDEVDRQEKIWKSRFYTRRVHLTYPCHFLFSQMNGYTTLVFSRQPLGASKKCSYTSFGHPGILKVARPRDVSERNS